MRHPWFTKRAATLDSANDRVLQEARVSVDVMPDASNGKVAERAEEREGEVGVSLDGCVCVCVCMRWQPLNGHRNE